MAADSIARGHEKSFERLVNHEIFTSRSIEFRLILASILEGEKWKIYLF